MGALMLHIRNTKLFRSILLSYLVILIAPIIGMLGYYGYSYHQFKEELRSSQLGVLSRVQSEMDLRFENIYYINDLLASSENVIEAANYDADTNLSRLFDTVRTQNTLRNTQMTIDNYETFIFFSQSESVLAPSRRYRSENVESFAAQYQLSREDFIETMKSSSVRSHKIINANTENAKLLFIRTIYSGKINVGCVVTVVPIRTTAALLDSFDWLKRTDCYILSSTDSLLISTNDEQRDFLSYDDLPEGDSLTTMSIGGEKYFISCMDSNLNGWRYCVSTPQKVVLKKLQMLQICLWLIVIFSAVVGVYCALVMSHRHYTPIQRIAEMFSNNVQQYASIDDLPAGIEKVFTDLKSENWQMEHELYLREPVRRRVFINHLLRDQPSGGNILQGLQEWEPRMQDEPSVVLLFWIADFSQSIFVDSFDGSPDARIVSLDLMSTSSENVTAEILFSSGLVGVTGHLDKVLSAVCQTEQEDFDWEAIRAMMQKIIDFHREVFHIRLYVVCSEVGEDLTALPQCYRSAQDLLNLKQFWGDKIPDIMLGKDIRKESAIPCYGFVETRKRLLNLLVIKDYKGVRQLLMEQLSGEADEDLSKMFFVRTYMLGLIGMVLESLVDSCPKEEQFSYQSLSLQRRLTEAGALEEVREEILQILDQVIAWQEHKETAEQPSWVGKVCHYIEANYASSALDVSMIAGAFDLNVSYLSRTFKKFMQVGILEYIHRTRLSHCKQLLTAGTSVREAAKKCGYIDSKALIRAFKRYEGVTPGQWSDTQK